MPCYVLNDAARLEGITTSGTVYFLKTIISYLYLVSNMSKSFLGFSPLGGVGSLTPAAHGWHLVCLRPPRS